jgi:hypothetical protein
LTEYTDPATLNAYIFASAQVTDYKGNVCVIWNISLLHGTSWYYDDLEHVGIAFVLQPIVLLKGKFRMGLQ